MEGHERAFHFFGVPRRIAYDNLPVLGTAQETQLCTAFSRGAIARSKRHSSPSAPTRIFESYYLFESRYCTPRQAYEKWGVENYAGYAPRNFMAPVPEVNSYTELNKRLRLTCIADMHRNPCGA